VSAPLITPLEAALTAALPPAPVPIFSEIVQPVIVHGLVPVNVDPVLKSPLGTEIGVCAFNVTKATNKNRNVIVFLIRLNLKKLFEFCRFFTLQRNSNNDKYTY
jgi:hypothetical protein